MTGFNELVDAYRNRLTNRVILDAKYPGLVLECQVLNHKVSKHYKNNNARSVAKYLALFFREHWGQIGVPKATAEMAMDMGIVYHAVHGVGYPHSDGTHHFFRAHHAD
jgi:hypothetical protein